MELEMVACSPWQLVLDVIATLRVGADERRVILEAYASGPLPSVALMDPTRTRQILMNLGSNAVKFSEPGGRIVVRVGSRGPENGRSQSLWFEVEDWGIGMAPEVVGQLFTPFHQADCSTTRNTAGQAWV